MRKENIICDGCGEKIDDTLPVGLMNVHLEYLYHIGYKGAVTGYGTVSCSCKDFHSLKCLSIFLKKIAKDKSGNNYIEDSGLIKVLE